MKYETQILDAFEVLRKKPRGNQVRDIDRIITAYIDEGYENIILNASTGAGKSIIGAVVAEVMHKLNPYIEEDGSKGFASFILMGQNILTDQYADTFKDNYKFVLAKGVSNYSCDLLSTMSEPKFGDDCCRADIMKSKEPSLIELVNKFCDDCELFQNRKARRTARHLITNYSFYFIDRLFANQYTPRTITVWDECHTINDIFSEHCAIFVSEKRLDFYAEEISKELDCSNNEVFQKIKKIKLAIINGTINDGNFRDYLEDLADVYTKAKVQGEELLKSISMSKDMKRYSKIKKIAKKYADLNCKIGDFFEYEYEAVFELVDKKEFTIKPIFVGDMFNTLINSPYQLFMSATCSQVMMEKTLNLNPETTKFIKLEPTFPKEHKKIIFYGIDKLNYETMKNPKTIDKLGNACNKITNSHIKLGESGIILTPSFDVTIAMCKAIKGVKIFEHERGMKVADCIREFKDYKKPSVLVSPSLWEGISLDDEHSRFQVFVKCPFASLGDKRTSYIATAHKEMYTLGTILKLVQGSGRSVRSEEDWATTYMLDQMISWTWKSPLNVWRDEFLESYQTFQ